jgi:hypothetical protein
METRRERLLRWNVVTERSVARFATKDEAIRHAEHLPTDLIRVTDWGGASKRTIWDKRPYEVWWPVKPRSWRSETLFKTKSLEEAIAVAKQSGFGVRVKDVNADRIVWEGPISPRPQAKKRDRRPRRHEPTSAPPPATPIQSPPTNVAHSH